MKPDVAFVRRLRGFASERVYSLELCPLECSSEWMKLVVGFLDGRVVAVSPAMVDGR